MPLVIRRPASRPLLIRGMYGLGDNIYQRAFLRHLPGAYLVTTWPELYADLDVRCVRGETTLRTQAKNLAISKARWHLPPPASREVRVGYGHAQLSRGSIVDAMHAVLGVQPDFDLPDFSYAAPALPRHYAIVRPVTIRREWRNDARAPQASYVAAAARILRARGYYVVSVADLAPGEEWLMAPAPEADHVLHDGQWPVSTLLAAIAGAAVVVGGVGWIVPAAIAAGVPAWIIQGGNGAHNAPDRLVSPRMDLSRIGWAMPDRYCRCSSAQHRCNKVISGHDEKFSRWLDGQGLLGTRGGGLGLAA